MITASAPVHTATINGVSVRFFRGPTDAPDMPWHVHDELLTALALPRPLRRVLRAAILKHWKHACRTVEVNGEPVLLAPHFVAQGMVGMAQDVGGQISTVPDTVDREYGRAGAAALKILVEHLPTPEERVAWACEAVRNQGGAS